MKWFTQPKIIALVAFAIGVGLSAIFFLFFQQRSAAEKTSKPQTWYSHQQTNDNNTSANAANPSTPAAPANDKDEKANTFLKQFEQEQADIDKVFDKFFDNDFFHSQKNPFEEMRKMRERMRHKFGESEQKNGRIGNSFNGWFQHRFGGGDVTDISSHEDNKFIYYDIRSKNLDKSSLNVKLENGIISISGETRETNESNGNSLQSKSVFISRFQRSFPAPDNVETDKMQILADQEKITLKFPKKVL